MNETQAILLIIGGIIITQGLRYLGLAVGGFLPTSGRMGAFLNAIPITILTGLVAPGIFNGDINTITGAAVTAIVAYVTKNMLAAMICGVAVVVILRQGLLF